MSKGIGTLQRDILDTLDEAKALSPRLRYRGGASKDHDPLPYSLPGWVWHIGTCVRLADGVYDLRASSAFLSQRRELKVWNSDKFQASFSRAVRSLVTRGLIVPLSLVPIQGYDPDACRLVERLAEGDYLNTRKRQVRFVHRPSLP